MRRHDAIALALLAAIVTLLFADVLLGFRAFYIRDFSHYYYPAKHVLREIVLGGEFPYWNPYFGAGQPMAANPEHEVFYPLTWLILLPSFRAGIHLLTVLHLYIAAFAMYALLRSLRARPAAAFFGALAFATGGIALSYLNLLPCLFTAVWIPLTCLYTRRFLLHRAWRDFALAALFFGIELWVGEPSTVLLTGLLLGAYALHRGVRDRGARPVAAVALISIAAFGVGAVQMIPALDHAGETVRARGLPHDSIVAWSTPPARLLEFVFPNVLGHLDVDGRRLYWGAPLYGERAAPFLYSIYPGLLLSVLALAGVLARVRGRGLALAVAIPAIVLALGGHTPLWRWLYDAGLARSLRYPEKFLLLAIFTAIVFGTRALDELLDGNARVRTWAMRIAIGVAVVAVVLTAFAYTPLYATLFTELWTPRPERTALLIAASATGWLAAAARAGAVVLLIRNASRRATWLALAAAFTVADLGLIQLETAPRMPARFYDEAPLLARALPADRSGWRLFHHADWHQWREEVAAYFAPHPDAYWIRRNAMFPMMPAQHGIRMALDSDFDRTALLPTVDFADSIRELANLRRDWIDVAASMSNLEYRAVFLDPRQAYARAAGDRRVLQPVGILPLGRHPRYSFAARVESITGREDFVRKLARGGSGRHTAFVRGPSWTPAAGRVLSVRETANSARIDVETAGRAFLVISVTPHKYWTIRIDGAAVPAVVTNIGYQGVVVTRAGRHVVEMRYRNPLIAAGAAVSAASLLVLALLAWRGRPAAEHAD